MTALRPRAIALIPGHDPEYGALNPAAAAGDGAEALEYDSDAVEREYEVMTLRIVHRRRCTGFEESKDFPVRNNDLIAGRYQARQGLRFPGLGAQGPT